MKLLITGYSSLLAQALAKNCLASGDEVYMTSRGSVEAFDERIKILPFDLATPEVSAFDGLTFDAVVLNAMTKTPPLKAFHKFPLDEGNLEFLRANVEGNVRLLQTLIPRMVEQKFGRIVYVSSMTTVHPMTGYSFYGAAKGAMESLIRSIAFEYGRHNITANTIRPGILATERNRRFREKFHAEMTKNISLKEIATPEQIVEAMIPLLSKTCYIQGAEVNVSGGLFIPN